jgi:hypothetical protein
MPIIAMAVNTAVRIEFSPRQSMPFSRLMPYFPQPPAFLAAPMEAIKPPTATLIRFRAPRFR